MDSIYFADFETTHDKNTPQVFMFQITGDFSKVPIKRNKWAKKVSRGHTVYYGYHIKHFLELILLIPNSPTIYFNNLFRFDGHFILPYIVNVLKWTQIHDFDLDELRTEKRVEKLMHIYSLRAQGEKLLKEIKKKWNYVFANEFKSLIDENKGIYEIKIGKQDKPIYKKDKEHSITIRCMLRLFITSINGMGETLNKHYNKDIFSKGEIDYLKYTKLFNSLKDLQQDKKLVEYGVQDIVIMAEFYKLVLASSQLTKQSLKLTAAGTAYNEWVKVIGKDKAELFGYKRKKIKGKEFYLYYSKRSMKGLLERALGMTVIRALFPIKWLQEVDTVRGTTEWENMKPYYNGGLSYVNEKYRGALVSNCSHLDINSSYPTVMRSSEMAPYGEPTFGDSDTKPFKFYKITILNAVENTRACRL